MNTFHASSSVTLAELKKLLNQTDPGVVLVPLRVLRGIIQREYRVPYLLAEVPHGRCHVFDRQVLFREVEQDKLDLDPDRRLPETVLLIARPTQEELEGDLEALLLAYWRLLFHCKIDEAMNLQVAAGNFSRATLRSRIEVIGQTEFEEIRSVLREENCLTRPDDDLHVYIEFCAVYLDLRYFAPNLRASYFPSLRNLAVIDALLAQDVEAETLFRKTRLPGAPDPVVRTDTSSDESNDYYHRLLKQAETYSARGDTIRAAIIHTRAARIAPAALTQKTRRLAHADLERLTQRLAAALNLNETQASEWLQVLPSLLEKADQGQWTMEARLLYDLQNVCVEFEKRLFALDVVEWLVSAGYRPIQRPLHSLQVVRMTKHLRSAAQRLTQARISDEDRQRLRGLLQTAQQDSEDRLRERFRPVLADALYDVGLLPKNRPEQVAKNKLIEELLDRITEFGFFTFADLRDCIARNQLKMEDLTDPHDFWRGDALLRLDRRLSTAMDGVYRRGEFYLRMLERLSSLLFGTQAGRFLTVNLVVPFGGAFVLLAMIEKFLLPLYDKKQSIHPQYSALGLGAFFLLLTHSSEARRALLFTGRVLLRSARFLLFEGPRRFFRLPIVKQVLGSWTFLLFNWYVLKPLLVSAAIWWLWPETARRWDLALVVFGGALLALHSKYGVLMAEAFGEMILLLYSWLRFDLLRGLYRWTLYLFRRVSDGFEYVMYSIDEWLRFSSGESRWRMATRMVLGALWFPFGYLIRFYFVTMVEPSINPLKLPLSSLAAKFMYPLYLGLLTPFSPEQKELMAEVEHLVGYSLAMLVMLVLVWPTLYLLPSVFAFFVWEMKGNWRAFASNRSPNLGPVVIDQRHGETMPMLLRPGFHSGTVPKLFSNLRGAERQAYRTGQWRSARTYRQALEEVADNVRLFVDREFIALLRQQPAWADVPLLAGPIELAGNRVTVQVRHGHHPNQPLQVAFDERSGWLLAGIQEAGWLSLVDSRFRELVLVALAGFYKLAGVDLVREQLLAQLAPREPVYDVTDEGLALWPEARGGVRILYNLYSLRGELRPRSSDSGLAADYPSLRVREIRYALRPLAWEAWVEFWDASTTKREEARHRLLGDWQFWRETSVAPRLARDASAENGHSTGAGKLGSAGQAEQPPYDRRRQVLQ